MLCLWFDMCKNSSFHLAKYKEQQQRRILEGHFIKLFHKCEAFKVEENRLIQKGGIETVDCELFPIQIRSLRSDYQKLEAVRQ